MKRMIGNAKKAIRQTMKGRPSGSFAGALSPDDRPKEVVRKEDFQWIAELQSVLSPYWSARFSR